MLGGRSALRLLGLSIVLGLATHAAPSLADGVLAPGYVSARVGEVSETTRPKQPTRIRIELGANDGVFPGAKGWLATATGAKVPSSDFIVDEALSPHAVQAHIATPRAIAQRASALVQVTERKCTPPNAQLPSHPELEHIAEGGAAPTGWMAFELAETARADWPRIKVGSGTDRGIVPPVKAWLVLAKGNALLHPVNTLHIGEHATVLEVAGEKPAALREATLHLIVSTGVCSP